MAMQRLAIYCHRMFSISMTRQLSPDRRSLVALSEMCRSAIESVSPRQLACGRVRVKEGGKRDTAVMCVDGRDYALNHNVKVVAFGKAALGMVEALESLLGPHVTCGVASVPVGSTTTHRDHSNISVFEGAANNLPDPPAHKAACEILAVCREAREGDVVVALISGGGSALLPYPIEGVQLEEKRMMIEVLAKAGASIQELNTFRKYFSRTKGGKLAEAAYPAQMVALLLSDAVGDPLDVIASGPTVPCYTTRSDIIRLVEKYSLTPSLPLSIQNILSQPQTPTEDSITRIPIRDGSYGHVQNVIVGSSKIATAAVAKKASSMGYRCVVWSHAIEGEARVVGEAYAIIAHGIASQHSISTALSALRNESCFLELTRKNPALSREFEQLEKSLNDVGKSGSPCNLCLVSGGETTVTVTGEGKGGRNQELALAFSLKYNELQQQNLKSSEAGEGTMDCVLMSLGTDGQDGPTDAAGAIGHASIPHAASAQGLDGGDFLRRNDSYSFFSRLQGGKYLLKTGLTGTNVMDIHCILLTNET